MTKAKKHSKTGKKAPKHVPTVKIDHSAALKVWNKCADRYGHLFDAYQAAHAKGAPLADFAGKAKAILRKAGAKMTALADNPFRVMFNMNGRSYAIRVLGDECALRDQGAI